MTALQAFEAARQSDLEPPVKQRRAVRVAVEDEGPKVTKTPDDLPEEHPADLAKSGDESE